jgi:hypothetical protein
MAVLWWLVGVPLVYLSLLLYFAGLTGRDGVLRIGKKAVAERRQEPSAQHRPARLPNLVLGLAGALVGLAVIIYWGI